MIKQWLAKKVSFIGFCVKIYVSFHKHRCLYGREIEINSHQANGCESRELSRPDKIVTSYCDSINYFPEFFPAIIIFGSLIKIINDS